jgi:maltooligosyltrehalose synthase
MVAADGGARAHEVPRLVVVAVRLATTLRRVRRPDDDVWARTYVDLPDGVWRDVLVDPPAGVAIDAHSGRVDLASLVGDRPAALLVEV